MHSNLTAPPPPPPPQKNTFRGCKLSCSLLPAKKIYRKRYWLPFASRYIQPSKNNNKDETKYTEGSDSEKPEK